MSLKLTLNIFLVLLFSTSMLAQENVFLSRDYWKANPSIEKIKSSIADGNDPAELNKYAFDAIVYALLEKTNNDVIKYLLTLKGNEIEKRTHDSRTYIFWAAYKGNVSIMQHLFDNGAVIKITDSHGNTPVTFAAVTGQKNKDVYALFEKNGAVLNKEKNKDGVGSLLLVAPYLDTEKELNYFLSKGFNLNDKDPIGNNIFNYAAKNGNIPFLKLLIEKGINPKEINTDGGNAILYASQGTRNSKNTLETYQYLESLGIKVDVVGDNGRNPLHAISYSSESLDLFSYFIKKGVDINLQDDEGNSPFMNSVQNNDLNIVKFLGTYVTDFNSIDKKGQSALTKAVNRNSTDIVDFLLKKGTDVAIRDIDNNTLAYYLLNTFSSKDNNVFETKLKLLENNGLSINQKQNKGNTLLHIATAKNNLELLKRLTSFNIDVNARNEEGYTALHIAAMTGKDDNILKYLLSIGADKTVTTEFNETVLDLATENELLQEHNVKLNFLR